MLFFQVKVRNGNVQARSKEESNDSSGKLIDRGLGRECVLYFGVKAKLQIIIIAIHRVSTL